MKRIVSSIAAVASGLWLTSACALGLGEIEVRSHLNQRFDAVIPLTSVEADELAGLRVSLASPEDFTRAGLDRADYLSSLRFAVRSDGAPRIEISSDKVEREPFVQLLLEVRGNGNRILRQYTVLLDPPGMASSPPPAAAELPIAPAAAAAPASAPAQASDSAAPQSIFVEVDHPTPPPDERPVAPRSEPVKPVVKQKAPAPELASLAVTTGTTPAVPVSGELYGPVKPGETLWSIATRVRGSNTGLSMDQVLLSLYTSNPRAFDGGLNGLNRGAMLSIPAAADMSAIDAADAHAQVARLRGLSPAASAPVPHARKPVIEPAQIPPPPPAAAAAELAPEPAMPAAAEPAGAGASASAPNTASSTDIAATDSASSSAPGDAGQAGASDTAPDANAAADTSPSGAPPAASDTVEPAVPQLDVPKNELAHPIKPAKSEGLLQTLLIPLIIGLLLLSAIAWLFARWRARRAPPAPAPTAPVEPRRRMPLSTPSASESAIASAAAVTATQKLTPQEELDRLQASISGRTQDVDTQQLKTQQTSLDASSTTETATITAAADDHPPVDFDLTGQFATQTVQIDLDANDPVSEADFHLAYGLYDEAALLLRQAADKEPQRTDIGIKLAETYFAAGKTAEFAQIATELKPKLSAAEWQKLAIMGQQLDPASTQFSDTASASGQTSVDPGFDIDPEPAATAAGTANPGDGNALDFNFDSEPVPARPAESPASMSLQADNGLDFKLDDLELPSLDVDQHEAQPATTPTDSNALDFDLGGFDAAPASDSAHEPPATAAAADDASSTLDFDLGDFDGDASTPGEPASVAGTPNSEAPIEEFDFDSVSPEAGDLTGDEAATKLDLARAYVEMGDHEMARSLLGEVLEQGNAEQKKVAQSLVEQLA